MLLTPTGAAAGRASLVSLGVGSEKPDDELRLAFEVDAGRRRTVRTIDSHSLILRKKLGRDLTPDFRRRGVKVPMREKLVFYG